MLELDRLTKTFGANVALHEATLSITPGAFVGVIGRSGAGKSTLLRTINRLSDATGGQIRFNGENVSTFKGAELRRWRR